MTRRKILITKCAVALAVVPVLIYAYAEGPDPGYAGVPGESDCTACHRGTLNSGPGSVKVAFPNGLTYAPGVKQHLVLTIQDPSQQRWGFELTARQANSTQTEAGTFTPGSDGLTQVICSSTNSLPSILPCSADAPLEYIEHSFQGTRPGQTGSATFEFDWTPPASNTGNVVVYVAGNAANGDGSTFGDHIYTASYTLTPAASGGGNPAITRVENAAGFQTTIAPGAWLDIRGTNLASTTDTWGKAVVNGVLPTQLDSVSVSIGGKPAFVYYVSPTQINALAPLDVGTGNVQVVVTNKSVSSNAANVVVDQFSPACFLWPGSYVVATRQDFSLAVKTGEFQGLSTTPAKPGDILILWGTGFGPTNPLPPNGKVVPVNPVHNVVDQPVVTIGGVTAKFFGGALASGSAGLYQLAIQVPALADGDWPVSIHVGGVSTPAGALLTVHK
jgi:uncharacterized protein (TIGR03437 family)